MRHPATLAALSSLGGRPARVAPPPYHASRLTPRP